MKLEITDIITPSEAIAQSEVDYVLESGEVDILHHFLEVKKQADVAKAILANKEYSDTVERLVIAEKGKYSAFGAVVSLKNARKEWSYTPDPELTEQLERIEWAEKALKEEKDAYEAMLTNRRSLKNAETVVSEEGDVFTKYPAYETTSSKKTLTTTFAK